MNEITVTFRLLDGDVIALFPYETWCDGCIASYMHIGQHSGASRELLCDLPKASKKQYNDLLKELEGVYNDSVLIVVD